MFMCTDIHVDNGLMLELADRDECLYRTVTTENRVKYKRFATKRFTMNEKHERAVKME